MLPRVTHNCTSLAPHALAQSSTASTRSRPTPVRRTVGWVHIDTSSTISDAGSSLYPPTSPTMSSSVTAKNVARSDRLSQIELGRSSPRSSVMILRCRWSRRRTVTRRALRGEQIGGRPLRPAEYGVPRSWPIVAESGGRCKVFTAIACSTINGWSALRGQPPDASGRPIPLVGTLPE